MIAAVWGGYSGGRDANYRMKKKFYIYMMGNSKQSTSPAPAPPVPDPTVLPSRSNWYHEGLLSDKMDDNEGFDRTINIIPN